MDHVLKKVCIKIFETLQFIITKIWKQPHYPSPEEWIKIEYKAKKVTSWILEIIAKAKEFSNDENY